MADGGGVTDSLNHKTQTENSDLSQVTFPSNQLHAQIFKPLTKMSRLIQKLNLLFAYLWSQSPGFMIIFYLCYLYSGSYVYIFFSVISVAAFIYHIQDSLLYQPNMPSNSRHFVMTPQQFNLPHEDLFLTTSDGVSIHAYFLKQSHASTAYTILVLHGNAGNIGHRLYNCQFLYQQCNVNILLLEYRGYGRSQGSPSEEGLVADALTGIEHLLTRNDINHNKILIFGRSLGGAVAIAATIRLSTNPQTFRQNDGGGFGGGGGGGGGFPAGVILENTFTSIRDMARDMVKIPFVSYIPEFLIKNKFNSLESIGNLHAPTLFISGQVDEIVPPPMMMSLFEKSGSLMKEMYKLPNGTHNECWRLPGYYENINNFILKIENSNQEQQDK